MKQQDASAEAADLTVCSRKASGYQEGEVGCNLATFWHLKQLFGNN